MLTAVNPATGRIIQEYPTLEGEQIGQCIARAHRAYPHWRDTPMVNRSEVLHRVAAALREEKGHLAQLMAMEMGKPVKEGGPEVEKAAWCAEHYAENARHYLADEPLASDASRSYVTYQPLGTLLGILPWNAPLWLAFRYLAPALMAGNTCVMKHDPNVPGCAQAIADVFINAGAPDNIVVNLPVANENVETAIRDPHIRAISFTGSSVAGGKVASIAAAEIKPQVLELGGSDPCLVMADADLDRAADIAVLSRIINAGQSCIAAKRIIVEATIYGDFIHRVKRRLEKLTVGDPLNPETDIGPIARPDLRENLHQQVQATVEAGANLEMGGTLPGGEGNFYPVTLLTDVTPGMCAFKEETFGPVMSMVRAADLDEAIELANKTDYGLGASIWTGNGAAIEQAIHQLEAGQVAVNGIVKTDPRLPSGGIKRSGYGRELGPQGIREFVNTKQIWIA